MNKRKYIQGKLDPLLLPLGFVYGTQPNAWRYERSIPGPQGAQYKQAIYIQQSNFAKAIYLRMDNHIPEQPTLLDLHSIVPGEKRYQLPFSNDEDFKKALDYCAQAIQRYLIPRLDSLSKIVVVDSPTFEDQVYVYEHHEELAARFCQEKKVDYPLQMDQWQQLAYDTLMELNGQTYTQAKKKVIEMAAFYGEWVQKNRNGEWTVNSKIKTVEVRWYASKDDVFSQYIPVLDIIALCFRRVNEWPKQEEVQSIVFQILSNYSLGVVIYRLNIVCISVMYGIIDLKVATYYYGYTQTNINV